MKIAENLKKIREQKGLQQKQVALDIGIGTTNYNRIENGQREASIEVLDKLAKFYDITIDEIVNFEDKKLPPKEVVVQDKAILEQVELIQELEPDEKTMIFKMIDTFINQKKFKDFVKQNVSL